jgi:hypothetical protein
MLTLLFLSRRRADPAPLLRAQRERFAAQADRLAAAAEEVDGFDRSLLLWRMHNTTAAISFSDAMLDELPTSGG